MEIHVLTVVRSLHILTAALWLGAAALLTLFVMPSARRSGAAGGAVVAEAMRRGMGVFMASIAGLTILSGIALYFVLFGGRSSDGLHAGAVILMLGALAGIVAAIIGGAVLGRTARELAALAASPPSEATQARIAALHRRGALASKIVVALLVAALLLMTLSHSF